MTAVRIKLRLSYSILVGLLMVGLAVAFAVWPLVRSTPEPITLADLEQRHRDLDEQDAEAAVELAVEYATFIDEVGDLRRADEAIQTMLAGSPRFASSPEIVEKRRQLDAQMAQAMQRYGIDPETGWQRLLDDGLGLTDRALARQGLGPEQRNAAGLARGQILYQAGRFDEALKQVDEVSTTDGDAVLAHLLRGDIYQQMRRYDQAIGEYRAASLALTRWADEASPLSVRLAMSAMAGPRGASRHERRRRDRRDRVAAALRQVIADQVSILRGLQRIDEKQPAPPP